MQSVKLTRYVDNIQILIRGQKELLYNVEGCPILYKEIDAEAYMDQVIWRL